MPVLKKPISKETSCTELMNHESVLSVNTCGTAIYIVILPTVIILFRFYDIIITFFIYFK